MIVSLNDLPYAVNGPRTAQRIQRRLDPDVGAPDTSGPRRRGKDRRLLGRVFANLQAALMELVALLVPVDCVCCGVEDTVLCRHCAKRVRQLCRKPFRAEQESPALVDVDGTVKLGVVAAGPYRDELSQSLLSFKRLGQWRLAEVLAPCLGNAVRLAIGDQPGFCVVPVPSSGRAFRSRGFSPVHVLLRCMKRRGMLSRCPALDALEKTGNLLENQRLAASCKDLVGIGVRTLLGKEGKDGSTGQKGLGRGERARRVRGSMRVRPRYREKIRGQRCLIVDDVLTTGATLAEAARAVSAAGGIVCGAVVLAATRPPAYASHTDGDEPHGGVKTQTKNKWPKGE